MIHDNFFFFFKISLWMLISSQTIISQFLWKNQIIVNEFHFSFSNKFKNKHDEQTLH